MGALTHIRLPIRPHYSPHPPPAAHPPPIESICDIARTRETISKTSIACVSCGQTAIFYGAFIACSISARRKIAVWPRKTEPKHTARLFHLKSFVITDRSAKLFHCERFAIHGLRIFRQNFPPANTTGSSICQCFSRQKLRIDNSPKFFPARVLCYMIPGMTVLNH